MGKLNVPNQAYNYYRLTKTGKRKEVFCCYSDIAVELDTTRGSVAGKFYRAKRQGKNYILVGNNKIEREEIKTCQV